MFWEPRTYELSSMLLSPTDPDRSTDRLASDCVALGIGCARRLGALIYAQKFETCNVLGAGYWSPHPCHASWDGVP